jgi:hypothetical protein
MSEKSTTVDAVIAAPARAARPAVTEPRAKPKSKMQDWHRARIVIIGVFALAAVASLLAMVIKQPEAPHAANAGGELSAGKVVSYSAEGKECRQQAFDNETGRLRKSEPCDLDMLDGNSGSASSSPRTRLEGISKAFSGH